jgi:signal transduction histidine kinase
MRPAVQRVGATGGMGSRSERLAARAAIAALLVMCAVTAAITVSGSVAEYVWLDACARVLMVGAPIAVGLYARRRPASRRFGDLLIAAGAGWFVASFASSDDPVLYSIGRVAGWVVEVGLVYLVLAFPSGTLGRVDRALVRATVLIVALLYLPTALLVEQYPTPSPWAACDADCPDNAFMLIATEPAFVDNVLRPVRELLTVLIFAAATLRLAWRIEHASHLLRRSLTPVLAVAIFRLAAFAVGITARQLAPGSQVAAVVTWLIALAVPGLAFAFLVGLLRWRLFIAAAMERLATRLRGHPGPDDLRDALADAFEDPTLEVVYWLEQPAGHWADADGGAVDLPPPGSGRAVTETGDGERRIAAIIHDPVLELDRAFVDGATSYASITLDNHRLAVQTSALLTEVQESRARIQAAADQERQRIEHDLHDGAQQRLVTLRIKLELAAEQSADGDGTGADMLRALGREVDEALDEVRSLARGIYPAPLASRGLVEALRAAALRTALPASVLAAGVGRYSREVERAAYFCCLEAMQNADKHAAAATATVVVISDDGALTLEVRDDGAGFDVERVERGMGFVSMHDRLAAVGGRLSIVSSPGHGTRVRAVIPLSAAVRSPEPASSLPRTRPL